MSQALIYSCLFCRSGVVPGETICTSPLCKKKECDRQTALKCKELGIGMTQLQLFRFFRPEASP